MNQKNNIIFFASIIVIAGIFIGRFLYNKSQNHPGKELYVAKCANCHGADGKGLRKLIPPLAEADFVLQNKNKLACIIQFGLADSINVNGTNYNQPMQGEKSLENDEITDIVNYILETWYPNEPKTTLKETEANLSDCLIVEK